MKLVSLREQAFQHCSDSIESDVRVYYFRDVMERGARDGRFKNTLTRLNWRRNYIDVIYAIGGSL